MGQSVAICNQKGGVGKSTTAVNVGAYLATSGKRILLVDLDPQGNATISCGVKRGQGERTIYEVLAGEISASEVPLPTAVAGLEVLPSGASLVGAELRLAEVAGREGILRRACEPLLERYDAILFDCPPSLGLLTINALVASSGVLIPVQCEYLALEGLNTLMRSVEFVKAGANPELEVLGIVLTMVDGRARLTREVAEEVRRFFGELVFETAIPRSVRLAECPSFGKPICVYDPMSAGAMAYEQLAKEVGARLVGRDTAGAKAPVG